MTLTDEQIAEICARAERLRKRGGHDLSPSAVDRELLLIHIAEQDAALKAERKRADEAEESIAKNGGSGVLLSRLASAQLERDTLRALKGKSDG